MTDTLYVNAATGDDASGDGQGAASAYRTISRALEDIPSIVEGHWTIMVAPGEYTEAVRVDRFSMPSTLSHYQIRSDDIGPYIAIIGSPGDPGRVVLQAPTLHEPCLSVAAAIAFVDGITCRAQRYHGIEVSGGTLVLDDIRLIAAEKSADAVYAERSTVFLGGTLEVTGNFAAGLTLRTYSLARPGTRRNRLYLDADFAGVAAGIFLRDYGDLTSFTGDASAGDYSFHFENVRYMLYVIFTSSVFFGSGVGVTGNNIGIAIHVGHNSSVNATGTQIDNASVLVRCRKLSSAILEQSRFSGIGLFEDTDGSCHVAY